MTLCCFMEFLLEFLRRDPDLEAISSSFDLCDAYKLARDYRGYRWRLVVEADAFSGGNLSF